MILRKTISNVAIATIVTISLAGCIGSTQPDNKDSDNLVNKTVKTVVSKVLDSRVLESNPVDAKITEVVTEQCNKVIDKLSLNMMVAKATSYGCVKYAVPEVKEELKKQINKI